MTEVHYSKGQQIRSHDFPGLNRKHCYIEGEITEIRDDGFIEVLVSFDSLANGNYSRVGTMVVIPLESELDRLWEYGRIERIG